MRINPVQTKLIVKKDIQKYAKDLSLQVVADLEVTALTYNSVQMFEPFQIGTKTEV